MVEETDLRALDVRLAEAMGWTVDHIEEECSGATPGAMWSYGCDFYAVRVPMICRKDDEETGEWLDLPHYSSSLDEMAAVEAEIERRGPTVWIAYLDALQAELGVDGEPPHRLRWECTKAPAHVRARAALVAMGGE